MKLFLIRLFSITLKDKLPCQNHSSQTVMTSTPTKTLYGFILIVLLNLLAYGPSFSDPPRSDQLIYLGNTADQKDFYSLAIGNYAYNRTYQTFGDPRDESLFRPVIFFILGVQRWAFSYHFFCWQLTSFFLHLFVLWLLLQILLTIHPGRSAFFLTALFSVMPANNDMVTWHHLNGYLVAFICVLISLQKIWLSSKDPALPWSKIWAIMIALSIGSFIHEIGALYSALFAIYLAICSFKTRPLRILNSASKISIVSLPVAMLAVLSFIDSISRPGKSSLFATPLLSPEFLLQGLKQIIPASFWWLYTGAFATQLKIFPYQRTMVLPFYAFAERGPVSWDVLGLISVVISCALIILYFYLLKKHFQAGLLRKAALPALMLFLFVLMISFARLSYGETKLKLAESGYHGYLFWILFIISAYSVLPFEQLKENTVSKIVRQTIVLLLTATIAINFLVTLDINARRSRQMAFQKRLLNETGKLLKEYGNSPDFSFNISESVRDHVYADWITRTADPSRRGHVYLQLLYPDQYSDDSPKFTYTDRQVFQRNKTP